MSLRTRARSAASLTLAVKLSLLRLIEGGLARLLAGNAVGDQLPPRLLERDVTVKTRAKITRLQRRQRVGEKAMRRRVHGCVHPGVSVRRLPAGAGIEPALGRPAR